FSTRAESKTYRQWDVSVIGMTNLTEAKLAREAQIHYATIAMSTDYDVWHEGEDDVTVEAVMAVMRDNVEQAQTVIRTAIGEIAGLRGSTLGCGCDNALQFAVMTDAAVMPEETRARVALLLD
ncbi:MAG: 5'-methylthioadenosine phosphorylase, partial [Myxococcota bacterium]